MARKPKYTKEDFVKEAVNKMLVKHNSNYDTVIQYPMFYNGVWYPAKEIYEVVGSQLRLKPGNVMEQQIQRDRTSLTNEYNKLRENIDGLELEELSQQFNDSILKTHPWQWFEYYTWTKDEQEEFRVWFVGECRKRFRMTKKVAESEADWFLLGHGLRVVNE